MSHAFKTAAVAAALLVLGSCGPSDPRDKLLQERGRWSVQLLDWVQAPDDGRLTLSTRVSGPPNSSLAQLTVRLDLQDAQGGLLERRWHVVDLTRIQRGGPADMPVVIDARGLVVEQIAFSQMLSPEPDDEPHIVELQGIGQD